MKPETRDSGKGRFVCRRRIYSLPEPYREAVVLTELGAMIFYLWWIPHRLLPAED